MSNKTLHHGQNDAAARLVGVAGDELLLQGIGVGVYAWEVEQTKQALDLELRASVVDTTAAAGRTPVVRYSIEYGHGDAAIEMPPTRLPSVSAALYSLPILPGRGLVLRLSARRFKIVFRGGLDSQGGNVPSNKVRVSMQPSIGRMFRALQYAQLAVQSELQPFPMDASEFRLRDATDGSAFIAGVCSVNMRGMTDELLATVDAAAAGYDAWTPVPPLAAAMSCSVSAQVEYR